LYFIVFGFIQHHSQAQSQLEADAYYKTGLGFKNAAVYDSALFFYNKALEGYKGVNNQLGVAGALNRIGIVHFRLKDYDKAMKYQRQSFHIHDSLQFEPGIMKNKLNIGNIYNRRQKYAKAQNHYREAIAIGSRVEQDGLLATTLNNLGALFIDHKRDNPIYNLDSAFYYFNKAFVIYRKYKSKADMVGSFQNFGRVYEEKQQYDSALLYYNQALEQAPNTYMQATLMENTGNVYKKQKDYRLARAAYQKGLDIAFSDRPENRNLNRIQTLSKNLADLYIQANDNDKAVPLLLQHITYKDSVYTALKASETTRFETIYQTERKEKELAESRAEAQAMKLRKQKSDIIYLISGLIALATIAFFIQRSRLNRIEARTLALAHSQEVNRLLQQQDLKVFDAIIEGQEKERKRVSEELHDRLGSVLTAAKMHLEAGFNDGFSSEHFTVVNKLLSTAIDDTRQISHDMLSGVLTKFGLLAALNNLKETVSNKDRLTVNLTTSRFDERLSMDKELHLYRIVQELLNNTLRHARASRFDIDLRKEADLIKLTVADNGIGGADQAAKKGIGHRNIHTRVERIGGEWTLSSPANKGTTATITLKV